MHLRDSDFVFGCRTKQGESARDRAEDLTGQRVVLVHGATTESVRTQRTTTGTHSTNTEGAIESVERVERVRERTRHLHWQRQRATNSYTTYTATRAWEGDVQIGRH